MDGRVALESPPLVNKFWEPIVDEGGSLSFRTWSWGGGHAPVNSPTFLALTGLKGLLRTTTKREHEVRKKWNGDVTGAAVDGCDQDGCENFKKKNE